MADIQPGTIKINSIFFTNFNQTETVDIQFIVSEFEIIEDMASPILRGKMVVHDTLSLFTRLPIVGLESIVVSFSVESGDPEKYIFEVFTHNFIITSMKHLHSTTMRSEIFVLELASPQIVPARSRRVVKSYQDTPIEDMVRSICEEVLGIPKTKLETESTGIPRDFVCPNLPPFETINILPPRRKPASRHQTTSSLPIATNGISRHLSVSRPEKQNFQFLNKTNRLSMMILITRQSRFSITIWLVGKFLVRRQEQNSSTTSFKKNTSSLNTTWRNKLHPLRRHHAMSLLQEPAAIAQ